MGARQAARKERRGDNLPKAPQGDLRVSDAGSGGDCTWAAADTDAAPRPVTARWDQAAFDAWMVEVDRAIARRVGMTSDDMEDWAYADAWLDGVDPEGAAIAALSYNGWEGE